MNSLLVLFARGGPAVIAILVLSVVLYSRCFSLLFSLRRGRLVPPTGHLSPAAGSAALRRQQESLRDDFRHDRVTLGAMIAAAPLLGLLGTVSGMVKTFEVLSGQTGQKSMGALAGGIAEVLVATESGLAVALPAMLLLYVAHRLLSKRLNELNELEENLRGREAP